MFAGLSVAVLLVSLISYMQGNVLAPLFAVPIGLYLGTERLHLRRLLAIFITVTGVILLVS